MKKVAILAPYFLPRRRVGAWRPYKFAIHLRACGWDPHIITIHESGASLTEREAELLADISVFEINSPFDFTRKLGRQLDFSGGLGCSQNSSKKFFGNLFKPALQWVDQHFPVDTWLPLFKLRKKEIEQYVEAVDPQLLWSTGDPWSSHWLAGKLADKYRLPWIADFRDPWTLGDIQLKSRSDFARRIDRREEQKIIQKASFLTFTSHQTEKLYRGKYQSEINGSKTIPNSYDSTLFNGEHIQTSYFDDNYLNLIFFGRFRPLSPARPLINLLNQIYRYEPGIGRKIRIYSFGALTEKERREAIEKNVYENFIILQPILLENALPILSQADILWLSTHPGRENIIPAKLWDYLAAKRPIISTVPNPEVKKILHQTGAGIQFDVDDTSNLITLLSKAVTAKMEGKQMPVPVAFDEHRIKQFDACVATQKLADIFDRFT